ncbi:Elongation factor P [Mesoplasma sp. JKS002658]|uniref:elongation factor P n=1 Tax=Mesoplasma whartonense TaxID=2878854 RepID=UPI002022B208|nr:MULTISPECIES: elongation factor P [unclassified Mesoplasma]MCL8211126.1 Elongation factor P [Mesoplasma sp. JKS002664]MCL8211787.1 Elongation factor P [Mesoplasma sp. JKS002662]MCL8214108.1 Elongation factor P [Mesoplasma sp. JKS002658]MCL8214464.1 Elongation factor P [Mesoplasma sp. JKS002663]MCL8215427.1 Elongation factor P [Mesoplasma sp. JKS002659]
MSVNDLRPGTTFIYDGNVYIVLEQSFSKTGRQQGKVTVKVRNMRSGARTEMTFTGGEKVEKAMIDRIDVQYLYSDGNDVYLMDVDTYDQFSLPNQNLAWELNFLTDGLMLKMTKFGDEILGIDLPDKVEMEIIEAEPAVKGDTSSGAQKRAKVQTGWEVQVPLFIKEGEKVLISTNDGKYNGRSNN